LRPNASDPAFSAYLSCVNGNRYLLYRKFNDTACSSSTVLMETIPMDVCMLSPTTMFKLSGCPAPPTPAPPPTVPPQPKRTASRSATASRSRALTSSVEGPDDFDWVDAG